MSTIKATPARERVGQTVTVQWVGPHPPSSLRLQERLSEAGARGERDKERFTGASSKEGGAVSWYSQTYHRISKHIVIFKSSTDPIKQDRAWFPLPPSPASLHTASFPLQTGHSGKVSLLVRTAVGPHAVPGSRTVRAEIASCPNVRAWNCF